MEEQCEPVTKQSLKELIQGVISKWSEFNAPRLGAALSFYTMLSIAPLLVVAIAIAGRVFGEEAARGQIVWQIENLVGHDGGQAIQTMLEHAHRPGAGIVAGLVGMLTLLFGASGVFLELRDALNLIWGIRAKQSSGLKAMIHDRFTAFAMVVGIGFLLMVSLLANAAITAAGDFFAGFLPVPQGLLHVINIVVSLIGVTICFALLYKVVPDARIEWRDVGLGAAVTAGLFTIGKFLIGLYIGKAALGSAFGAAGSLVVFLVWVYYSAQIFYLGAEFTHAFAERHGSRALTKRIRDAARRRVPQPRPA
jgi:membrane protein